MQTTPIRMEQFRSSVLAVPPLARDERDRISRPENERLIRHIEGGGVSMLLYGGNANLYHVRPSEYADLLDTLETVAGKDTLVIPSVGPSYGLMMDQAEVLKGTRFPTAMVLPTRTVMTEAGLMNGFRRFVDEGGVGTRLVEGEPEIFERRDERGDGHGAAESTMRIRWSTRICACRVL